MERAEATPDVAIVGGGICGLTTALALERRGLTPTVYEAAAEYRPVGAGILLQTNALLVLDRLGVAGRVQSAGLPLEESQIRSPDGRVLQRFDLDEVEREDFDYGHVAIHRADLQRILLDELDADVRTGMACDRIIDPDAPTVAFEDGTRVRPDVVVGADGIDSTVRDGVAPGVETRTLDSVAYRAVTSVALPERHRAHGFEIWDRGTYTGGAPIDDERFYWFGTAPERLPSEAAGSQASVSALCDRFGEHPAPVPSIVDSLDGGDVIVTDLADVPALDRWSRGAVVLAGDAAHGMLPFAGQGAAQAIEDALTLGHAIATHDDPDTAFDAYERERKPRADRIRSESHRLGRLAASRSSVVAHARNLAFGLAPDALVRRFRRRRVVDTSLPEGTGSTEQ